MEREYEQVKIYGTSPIGPKGQIVIPKEVRNAIGLECGDILVFMVKSGKFIAMVKNDQLSEALEFAKSKGLVIE
ncbi:MAG: AbrB/MazE/SpoVT family DNA-binding domain-containing protein [Candidatus Absconditabacteria bacterium]